MGEIGGFSQHRSRKIQQHSIPPMTIPVIPLSGKGGPEYYYDPKKAREPSFLAVMHRVYPFPLFYLFFGPLYSRSRSTPSRRAVSRNREECGGSLRSRHVIWKSGKGSSGSSRISGFRVLLSRNADPFFFFRRVACNEGRCERVRWGDKTCIG